MAKAVIALDNGLIIRQAVAGERAEIERLDTVPVPENLLTQSILNRCLLVAKSGRRVVAAAGLDPARQAITLFRTGRGATARTAAERLVEAVERLAVRYGVLELSVRAGGGSAGVFRACGYRAGQTASGSGADLMKRTFARRQTRYSRRIFGLLDSLGIDRGYAVRHRIPLQAEATRLVSIGPDVFDREQRMLPSAASAWRRMKGAAAGAGIEIQAVSAYRSVDYQAGIIQRKRERGQTMEQILRVSAAPGFSEHHTGRAIDVTTPGFDALEEVFERSPAFDWLRRNAADFGFHLSFPRNNRHGVAFEPWHWAWSPPQIP